MPSLKEVFALSKAEVKSATPLGTATLVEHSLRDEHGHLKLVPRPTLNPADPLNLPIWRKYAIVALMALYAFTINFSLASISSALPIYASTNVLGPPKKFSRLTYLIACPNLMLGVSSLFWVPLASTIGRRYIVLAGMLIFVLSSMWAGLAKSFNNLLAARFVMGIGGGPADAIAPAIVSEIFFLHQRGRSMAVYSMFLATGPLVGGACGGYIVANMSLSWLHWMNVLLGAIVLVLSFFLLAETLFERSKAITDGNSTTTNSESADLPKENIAIAYETTPPSEPTAESFPPYTYLSSLKIAKYRGGLLRDIYGLIKVVRLPGVWLVAAWQATLVGTQITISVVGPNIMSQPPYLWTDNVGMLNIGGIVGGLMGAVYTYLISDWATKRRAKRDSDGFTEPEARLTTALPAIAIAAGGAFIFGFVAQYPSRDGWVGLEFGSGMISFGLMQAPSVGFNYVIESYAPVAADCIFAVVLAKCVVSFVWTFFVGDWIERNGPAEAFGIFGMLVGLSGLLTLPFIIYGKRLRIWTAKWLNY